MAVLVLQPGWTPSLGKVLSYLLHIPVLYILLQVFGMYGTLRHHKGDTDKTKEVKVIPAVQPGSVETSVAWRWLVNYYSSPELL